MLDDKLYLIGVGLARSGTTTLHHLLANQPTIETPYPKETGFFRREDALERFWEYDQLFGRKEQANCRIDFTPFYERSEVALKNIQAANIKKKILLTLRHPIERAFSRYALKLITIHDSLKEKTITKDEIKVVVEKYLDNGISFFDIAKRADPVIFPSYAKLVKRCFDLFGRNNVLILFFEDWLVQRPQYVLDKLSDFTQIRLIAADQDMPRMNTAKLPGFVKFEGSSYSGSNQRPYLVMNGTQFDLSHLERGLVEELVRASSQWTDTLPAIQADKLFASRYAEDIEQMEEIIGYDIPAWRIFRDVTYQRSTV